MTKYNWKPTAVHVYLCDKIATLKNPEEDYQETRSLSKLGHQLGFNHELSHEQREKKEYRFDNEGLVLVESNPFYVLEVAQFNKDQNFGEYSWKVLGKTSRGRANGDVELITTVRLQQEHPYEGPVDSGMLYKRVLQEGDCVTDFTFEAFFYRGKLVAGWNYNAVSGNEKKPLTRYRDLAGTLNGFGPLVHPSEQQVKEFLRESNLPRTILTRFEEML